MADRITLQPGDRADVRTHGYHWLGPVLELTDDGFIMDVWQGVTRHIRWTDAESVDLAP